ncbi:MAG: hypothetical protein WDZ72_05005 [Cyclobacteriaceae bacterium]
MLKDELIELYTQKNSNYNYMVFTRLYEERRKFFNLDFSYNNLDQILDFERYVIRNKGINRFGVEEKVLEFLQMLILDLCQRFDTEYLLLNEKLINDTQDIKLKKLHQINFDLLNFAYELFNISIPRDSFSSRRKGYGLGIISRLLNYYEIPNKFDLFFEGLKSSKDKLIIEVLNELHYYHENFPEEHLSGEIISELDRIILKTKNRNVATGALNLQVITGYISEFEALSRIDVWKEKYYS